MNRYLLNISYIGTRFRGIQRTINKLDDNKTDLQSVQGCIEDALKIFKPVNDINLCLSSRTDTGVHAINSTVHVDLERKSGLPYNPSQITSKLNHIFLKNAWDVRVLNTYLVSNDFHCRFYAKSRTYLYRIAVKKNEDSSLNVENNQLKPYHTNYIPIEESDRCFFILDPNFDFEIAKKATKLFCGRHDFRTFTGTNKHIKEVILGHPTFTLRSINEFTITRSTANSIKFSAEISNSAFDYYDFTIKGKSFLYRQVRRMVGSIIVAAQGRITLKDIYEMLTIPSPNSWCPQACVIAPYGLYLCEVGYDKNELESAIRNKLDDLKIFEKVKP